MADRPTANALYNQAAKALRTKHPEEFADFLEQAYAEAGLEYRRRRSPAEREVEERARALRKAQATVLSLVNAYGADVLPPPEPIEQAE